MLEVNAYRVEFQMIGSSQIQVISTASPQAFLYNLEPNTLYNYRVISVCNGGKMSTEPEWQQFRTLVGPRAGCPSPAFTIIEPTITGAILKWDLLTEATGYRFGYKPLHLDDAYYRYINIVAGSINYRNLIGLLPGTEYEISIAARCGETLTEVTKSTFTTLQGKALEAPLLPQLTHKGIHSFYVFPNPNTGDFYLVCEASYSFQGKVYLRNVNGQTLREYQASFLSGTNELPISLTEPVPGMYFLTLEYEGLTQSFRVVIQ